MIRRLLLGILATACAASAAIAQPAADDMADMPGMAGMAGMAGMEHGGAAMPATGSLGAYPMTRDASGTSWQPDAAPHDGLHASAGGWSLMGHAMLDGVDDRQSGPRGSSKRFVAGMVMGAARRDFGANTVNLRVMLSPEPLMGPRGYPLLLAVGESADGVNHLVDRQHPHDMFMELSAAYSRRLSASDSLFVYAGLPGEPAFGPPAFMHRVSAMDSPEAPVTHHWMDSTHVTFGVVTTGWVHRNWKLEASRFRGREPDQNRWDIETGKLDSTAARLSWNPTSHWSLQTSWAHVISPEALTPKIDETRMTTSATYARAFGVAGSFSATFVAGQKRFTGGYASAAELIEAEFKPNRNWTVFGRAEQLESDALGDVTGHSHATHVHLIPVLIVVNTVQKASVGVIHDWRVGDHLKLGVGGLVSTINTPNALNFVTNATPDGVKTGYGNHPTGAMAFLRLVID